MILNLNGVSKSYLSGNQTREVLTDIKLHLNAGESVAIVGPSGSGKTTLLNIIGSLDVPDKGTVELNGIEISGLSEKDLSAVRNRQIGLVFQQHFLLPQCTLLQNILIPTLTQKENKAGKAEELTRELGIWDFRHQLPGQLSGGECQRTAVARALINQPVLILADEPTGALDEENATKLVDLLLQHTTKKGRALIVVTHSMEVAQRMDKIYHLNKGRLVEQVNQRPGK